MSLSYFEWWGLGLLWSSRRSSRFETYAAVHYAKGLAGETELKFIIVLYLEVAVDRWLARRFKQKLTA